MHIIISVAFFGLVFQMINEIQTLKDKSTKRDTFLEQQMNQVRRSKQVWVCSWTLCFAAATWSRLMATSSRPRQDVIEKWRRNNASVIDKFTYVADTLVVCLHASTVCISRAS